MDIYYIIYFILLLDYTKAQEWNSPGFLPNEDEKDRVQFEETLGDSEQIIHMNENIEEKITIAFLNYKGDTEPKITKFMEPSSTANNMLGAKFRRSKAEENWELFIEIPQDYDDKEEGFRYALEITAADTSRRLYLYINNLDDEKPIIKILNNPCKIKENTVGLSDCIYTIMDADGIIDNYVEYTLTGSMDIQSYFEIKNMGELRNGLKEWNTTLNVKQSLDYEKISSFVFDFTVEDSGGNEGTAKIVVEVIDLPDEPPVWRKIFSSKKFLEKQGQTFEVEATDGDIGINNPINYELISDWPELFSIETTTGVIKIEPINRDELGQEIFTFELRAFEVPDPKSEIFQEITIIVEDVNDNIPVITVNPDTVTIPENTATTLNFKIGIHDKDLGDNAMYTVSLGENGYHKAFQIVPNQAYQNMSFSISVTNNSYLDYEDKDWQEITLEINSQEIKELSHKDSKTVKVILQNWNDEVPIFDKSEYIEEVLETIGINEYISTVLAKDRDIGDKVVHSLIGKAINEMFSIDQNGVVKTKIDKAFDYEKQTVVIIQVQAEDTLGQPFHKTIAQLTVNVLDVNDEPPKIYVAPTPISIEENQKHGTVVNTETEITATDEDTESFLEFRIDWDTSKALKNSRAVPEEAYRGCIQVETVFDTISKRGRAILTINEIRVNNTPDYELYDTLHITLVVEDINQDIIPNTDTVNVIINIEDVNDNKPIFVKDTIDSTKQVVEHLPKGTSISTIIATDDDGSRFNVVSYTLEPADAGTPKTWVDIDERRGELFVNDNIDADVPIFYLNYTVIASDGKWKTRENITIYIIDTNDNAPKIELDKFKTNIDIKEKSGNGEELQYIPVTDADRDPEFNTPWFRFSTFATEEVRSFFSVDIKTGRVYVNYKTEDVLDRDYGTTYFTIPFTVGDNFEGIGAGGQQHKVDNMFTVTLLDINDHAPIIQTKYLNAVENFSEGENIGLIEAIDDDEPGTNNTKINFEILKIEKGDDAGVEPPNDLFIINVEDYSSGKVILKTGRSLRTYYGTYHILIKTNDFGEEQKTNESTVDVIIKTYNFKPPRIIYPLDGEAVYLSTKQIPNQVMYKYDGSVLDPFNATDDQNEKWDIKFRIDPNSNPDNLFKMIPIGKSMASLQVNSQPNYSNIYQIKIVADCDCEGDPPFTNSILIHIRFIDKDTEPYFKTNSITMKFPENETGLNQFQYFPEAYYNKQGEDWPLFKIFYILTEDPSDCFEVDKEISKITVKKMLDRELLSSFTVKITASQNFNGNSHPQDKSVLQILIEVIDENDNPPNFVESIYYSGVKPTDELTKTVLQITALDLDLVDSLQFSIVPGTMKGVGEGISLLKDPFYITSQSNVDGDHVTGTGSIHLNFTVRTNMYGYFTFDVQVIDEANHSHTTTVKIYVVSESSRIIFKFENSVDVVIPKEQTIKELFEKNINYLCNIETIQKATNEAGEPINSITDVFTHFINSENNEPVNSSEIQQIAGTLDVFIKLRSEFLAEGLYLLSFTEEAKEEDMEEVYRASLIAVSVLLGTFCVILIIAFIVKTRSLITRLNKLSTTQFGSQDSGLNRVGIVAPNTNKHAIEGSNPVYNNEKMISKLETASIRSGDSDLIGIEDNPNFQYDDYMKKDHY